MKSIANSLRNIQEHPVMAHILDPLKQVPMHVINEVMGYWTFDLTTRKPAPAYNSEGEFVGTDLDMATFLYSLMDRGAVIKIPKYKSTGKTEKVEGEMRVGESRFGKLNGIVLNKENYMVSLSITDSSIITSESVGRPRNFALTYQNGEWQPGWERIEFMPSAEENKFITESGIASGNSIVFKHFVHPNRWTSFFGQYYVLTKMLEQRLEIESQSIGKIISELKAAGIKSEKMVSGSFSKKPSGEDEDGLCTPGQRMKTIHASILDCRIVHPNMPDFVVIGHDATSYELDRLTELKYKYDHVIRKKLRFPMRLTEMSFANIIKEKGEIFPSWIKGVVWSDHKIKKTVFRRLPLFQPEGRDEKGHFLESFSYLYRIIEKDFEVRV